MHEFVNLFAEFVAITTADTQNMEDKKEKQKLLYHSSLIIEATFWTVTTYFSPFVIFFNILHEF